MSAESFPYDVFLSHSAKDKPVVRDVAERLRKDGLRVWFIEWEMPRRRRTAAGAKRTSNW